MALPDEPNLVIPMASTMNERGVAGYTHSVTNSEDQRKLNCMFEVAKNNLTGKGTLTLTKRPGVTVDTNSYGSAADTPMLICRALAAGHINPASLTNTPWIFFKSGASVKVADTSTTTTIFTDILGYSPLHVGITAISLVPNVVLQSKTISLDLAHRVFYGTAIGTWTEITDADFTSLVHRGKMEHLDGFAFILDRNGLIWNSDTNSLANWTATSFLAKQIKQDYPIGLARLGNQILAFGDYTVEMFYNAGNTTGSPLGRIAHQHEETGIVAPYTSASSSGTDYYCIIGKTLFFVGRRAGGGSSVGVFAYSGGEIEKISTGYIDKILAQRVSPLSNGYFSINSFGLSGKMAIAISLTAPTASTQRWLMFFPEWKEWFEWTSTLFQPVNDGEFFLGLGANANKVYSFPPTDNWQDNGTSYQWFSQFKLPTKGSPRNVLNMYGVDADTARSANDLTVEISTDDCQSFSTLGTIDLTQDRKVLFRGGAFRNAHIRIGNTNAVETRVHSFLARVNG